MLKDYIGKEICIYKVKKFKNDKGTTNSDYTVDVYPNVVLTESDIWRTRGSYLKIHKTHVTGSNDWWISSEEGDLDMDHSCTAFWLINRDDSYAKHLIEIERNAKLDEYNQMINELIEKRKDYLRPIVFAEK